MERKLRSLVKTLIYRMVAITTIGTLTYYYSGDIYTVTTVVIIYNAIAWSFYYFHERIWNRIQWGVIKPDLDK